MKMRMEGFPCVCLTHMNTSRAFVNMCVSRAPMPIPCFPCACMCTSPPWLPVRLCCNHTCECVAELSMSLVDSFCSNALTPKRYPTIF